MVHILQKKGPVWIPSLTTEARFPPQAAGSLSHSVILLNGWNRPGLFPLIVMNRPWKPGRNEQDLFVETSFSNFWTVQHLPCYHIRVKAKQLEQRDSLWQLVKETDMLCSLTQSVKADLAPDGYPRPQESRGPLCHHTAPSALLGVTDFNQQEGKGREAGRGTQKDPEVLCSSSVHPTFEN